MAEIKIEKKKKPVWPWIVAVLVIAVIVIWVWAADDTAEREDYEAGRTEEVERDREGAFGTDERDAQRTDRTREDRMAGDENLPEPVKQYVQFVRDNGGEMGRDHKYTHQGITQLADAIAALSEDTEVDDEVKQMKKKAEGLREDRQSDKHANMIREAFITASNLMDRVQQEGRTNMDSEVRDLEATARQVERNELATNQEETVNEFFEKSARVLRKMAQNKNV